MLLLWMSVVAALALAAPAPGTNGQRRGAAQAWPDAPNVVLVVSDSFVSTERRREEDGGAPGPNQVLAHSLPCAAGFGEQNLKLSNMFYPDANKETHFILRPPIHTRTPPHRYAYNTYKTVINKNNLIASLQIVLIFIYC